jgi:translation elongation factor EF-Tu-like GTPase
MPHLLVEKQMSHHVYNIEVDVTFLTAEQGGRKTPVFPGYRPQFYYDDHDWDALYDYGDVAQIALGQTVTLRVRLLSPHAHSGRLHPGTPFQLREGHRIVGHGHVTSILHLPPHSVEKPTASE